MNQLRPDPASATYAAHAKMSLETAAREGLACSIRRWTARGPQIVEVDPAAVLVTDEAMTLPDGTTVIHHGPGADPALPEIITETRESARMRSLARGLSKLSARSRTGLLRIQNSDREDFVETSAIQCTSAGVFLGRFASLSSEEIESCDVSELSVDIRSASVHIRVSL